MFLVVGLANIVCNLIDTIRPGILVAHIIEVYLVAWFYFGQSNTDQLFERVYYCQG